MFLDYNSVNKNWDSFNLQFFKRTVRYVICLGNMNMFLFFPRKIILNIIIT